LSERRTRLRTRAVTGRVSIDRFDTVDDDDGDDDDDDGAG
jgi:hypothetical protein